MSSLNLEWASFHFFFCFSLVTCHFFLASLTSDILALLKIWQARLQLQQGAAPVPIQASSEPQWISDLKPGDCLYGCSGGRSFRGRVIRSMTRPRGTMISAGDALCHCLVLKPQFEVRSASGRHCGANLSHLCSIEIMNSEHREDL